MAVTLTINGVNRTGLVDLTSIVCTLPGANISGECSFVLDDTSRQVTLAARQTVVIADGATTLWRGLIAAFRAEVIAGGMRRYRVTARDYGILLDDDATINTTFAAGTTEQTVLTSILSGTGLTVTGDANSALTSALTIQATSRRQAIEQLIEAIGASRYYWVNVSPALVYRATSLGAAPFVLVDGAPSAGQTDYESLAFDTDATASGTATTRGEAIVVGADGWQPGQTVTVHSTALGLTNATYYLASVGLEFHTDSVRRWRLGLGAPARLITTALASAPSLPPPRIASIAQFAASIRPPAVVASLPTLPNGLYPAGSIVYLTTDGKLYKTSDGSTWTAVVNATDLAGQITTTQISDGAISTPKLAANAVTTDKLAAGAVTANELAANSVVAGKVAAAAIGTNELAAGAVTADKVAANALWVGQWAGDPNNLVPNSGAELGSTHLGTTLLGWAFDTGWATRVGAGQTHSGAASFQYVAPSAGVSNSVRTGFIPVEGGRRYRASVWLSGWSTNSASAQGALQLSWFDGAQTLVSTTIIATVTVGANTAFQQIVGTAVAPTNAAYVRVLGIATTSNAAGDRIYFDDFGLYLADNDVDHAGGNVRIDSTGITITNGKLTFIDNYGATAMDGSGFGPAWQDFIHSGLYNGNFDRWSGSGMPAGWTLEVAGTFPPTVVTGTGWGSGNAIQYAATAPSTTNSTIRSDTVAITGRTFLHVAAYRSLQSGTGTVEMQIRLRFLDKDKATISTVTAAPWEAITGAPWFTEADYFGPPAATRYVQVLIDLRCTSGSATVHLLSVALDQSQSTSEIIPSGLIAAWSGSQLPPGWVLCNGANGTPDLRDRFIVGGNLAGGSTPAAGQSGGTVSPRSALPTHATHASAGSHTHDLSGSTAASTASTSSAASGTGVTVISAAHTHNPGTLATGSAGGHTHDAHSAHSVYQYYVLAWIMKA